jgi:hypothetical protein
MVEQLCLYRRHRGEEPIQEARIGRALIDRAIDWAKDRELPGLMLETQNDNVPACLFYERCGSPLPDSTAICTAPYVRILKRSPYIGICCCPRTRSDFLEC